MEQTQVIIGFPPFCWFWSRTPDNMLLLRHSLGHASGPDEDLALGVPNAAPEIAPEMSKAFQRAVSLLRKAGVSIWQVEIAAMLPKLHAADQTVSTFGARSRAKQFTGDLAKEAHDDLVYFNTCVPSGRRGMRADKKH